jgi:hypothetical protein
MCSFPRGGAAAACQCRLAGSRPGKYTWRDRGNAQTRSEGRTKSTGASTCASLCSSGGLLSPTAKSTRPLWCLRLCDGEVWPCVSLSTRKAPVASTTRPATLGPVPRPPGPAPPPGPCTRQLGVLTELQQRFSWETCPTHPEACGSAALGLQHGDETRPMPVLEGYSANSASPALCGN